MSKISFTTMGTPAQDGFEAIKIAKKFGFDGVDLRVSEVKGELTPESSDDDILALKRAFDSEGIQSAGLFCYGKRGIPVDDENYWSIFTDKLKRELHIGSVLGSPSIRMFGGDISGYSSEENYIEDMGKAITSALDAFPDMQIVLQNHCGSFTFLNGVKLSKLLNNDRFGIAFSFDHCYLMQENREDVLAVAKEHTKQLYLSDIKLDPDGKTNDNNYLVGSSIMPGQGDIQNELALSAVGGKDFEGWITFKWEKIWHDELEEHDVAFPHFLNYLKEILN